MKGLREGLKRKTSGSWWVKNWMWTGNQYLEPRKPDISLVASKEAGEEEDVAPLLHSGETQPGVLHSAPGSPR